MEFTNTEFTQFSLSVVLIRVVEFRYNVPMMMIVVLMIKICREIRVSKSQWGSLAQALAKKDTKIEKLVSVMVMMVPMVVMTMKKCQSY